MSGKGIGVRTIAITGIMIAVVAVFTRSIMVPIGTGFFNFSDVAIYFAAFAFGPWIGFVAGGVGAALADISLGYSQFALLTFFAHRVAFQLAAERGWRHRWDSPGAGRAQCLSPYHSNGLRGNLEGRLEVMNQC